MRCWTGRHRPQVQGLVQARDHARWRSLSLCALSMFKRMLLGRWHGPRTRSLHAAVSLDCGKVPQQTAPQAKTRGASLKRGRGDQVSAPSAATYTAAGQLCSGLPPVFLQPIGMAQGAGDPGVLWATSVLPTSPDLSVRLNPSSATPPQRTHRSNAGAATGAGGPLA